MEATIQYTLSPAGQKASLLSGGDGKATQVITVGRDDPLFPRLLARAHVGGDGSVSLTVFSWEVLFDGPQTAAGVLDALDFRDRKAAEAEAAALVARRRATEAVIAERRTRSCTGAFAVGRDGARVDSGGVVSAPYSYEEADWPYNSDPEVRGSAVAVAWVEELKAARAAAEAAALEAARAQLPALLAREAEAEAARAAAKAALTARKVELGGEEGDYLLGVEDGALTSAPVWESHKRGKNWLAVITVSPSSPGGLERAFVEKAKGAYYYLLPALAVGDALEFGADYYTMGGRKDAERWHGFVVAVTPSALLLRKTAGGKAACTAGRKWAEAHGRPAPADAVEAGIARINGEGAIVPAE